MPSQTTNIPTHDLYTEQLNSLNLGHGLYEPNPIAGEDEICIGDIGYIFHGRFVRFASAFSGGPCNTIPTLASKHHRTMPFSSLDEGVLASRSVRSEKVEFNIAAGDPISGASVGAGFNITCESDCGASLLTKYPADVEKSMFPNVLKKYLLTHCLSLLLYAHNEELPINNLHDIILVTGRVMTADWATLVFRNHTRGNNVSFDIKAATNTGASASVWGKWSEHVSYPKRHGPPRLRAVNGEVEPEVQMNQCIFIDACRVSQRSWFEKLNSWVKVLSVSPPKRERTPPRHALDDPEKTSRSDVSQDSHFRMASPSPGAASDICTSEKEMLTGYEVLAFHAFETSETDIDLLCIDEENMMSLQPASCFIENLQNSWIPNITVESLHLPESNKKVGILRQTYWTKPANGRIKKHDDWSETEALISQTPWWSLEGFAMGDPLFTLLFASVIFDFTPFTARLIFCGIGLLYNYSRLVLQCNSRAIMHSFVKYCRSMGVWFLPTFLLVCILVFAAVNVLLRTSFGSLL